MRYLLILTLLAVFAGCGAVAGKTETTQPSGLRSFPSPLELGAKAPGRRASGSDAATVRLLQSDGAEYAPWPGYSNNAEVSGSDALLHAMDGDLSYVMYQLGTPLVDNTDTLTDLRLDFSLSGPPFYPDGLYIGLPDLVKDHWVWIDAEEAHGKVLSIENLNLHGADPLAQPNGCFIALVNFSSSEATVSRVALRFKTPETVEGDEWLYFTEAPAATLPGVSRITPDGATVESIVPGEGSGVDAAEFGVPQVANYSGTWKLDFAKSGSFPPQLWRSDLDGTNRTAIHDDAGAAYNPAGHLDGTDRGLFTAVFGYPNYELWASDGVNEGRLSRAGDLVLEATWDLSLNPAFEYGAIASMRVDAVNSKYGLVSFSGSGPFPIDSTPTDVYTRLAAESAFDPEMIEYASLSGDPRYCLYFAANNRDDATLNIYRVRYPGGEPEAVVVDANYEFRFPAVSPNGRWLAYTRVPAGSSVYTTGELLITELLDPGAGPQVISPQCLYELSWYDPTP